MENDSNVTRMTSNSSESPTPTLQGSTGNHTTVPVATTDLGQALPNVKTTDGEFAEKDHHVSTADEPAAGDLGPKNGHYDEKATQTLPPPVDPTRTKSTTNVTHNADNAAGGLTVPGPGMPPNTKPTSRPPGVGMFGGAAPEGIDAEEGFWAPHSQSEEEARTAERAEKGADPWAVKFEVTDRDNPKVGPTYFPQWQC